MKQNRINPLRLICSATLAAVLAMFGVQAIGEQATELPPVFRASEILPGNMVKSPGHRVAEPVYNNGVLNQFKLTTAQGTYAVVGTQLLKLRLQELDALGRMEKFKGSKAYRDTFGKAVTAPIKGAKDLVTSPIETTKGAVRAAWGWRPTGRWWPARGRRNR